VDLFHKLQTSKAVIRRHPLVAKSEKYKHVIFLFVLDHRKKIKFSLMFKNV